MDQLNRGFSVLEVLLAMGIAMIVMSGVIASSGSFAGTVRGNQSTILNGQTNAEALTKGQSVLEEIQALNRVDFALINPTAETSLDGFYYKKVDVTTAPDFLTKLVTTTISWLNDHNATSTVSLSTLVTNLENIESPNTCNSNLSGDWTQAHMNGPIDVGDSIASGNPVTDIEVFGTKLYVVTNNFHGHNSDFYIYDLTPDPANPAFIPGSETDVSPGVSGLGAIAIASSSTALHAFVGNLREANFRTCTQGVSCAQMKIMDVTNPVAISAPINFKLATNTPPYVLGNVSGASGQALGKSIFYKDGFVYLGLTTTSNGPGFHIIDVGNGAFGGSRTNPKWVASWPAASPSFGTSGGAINAITVKGRYAYLAHPTTLVGAPEQLTILDVSDKTNPVRVGGSFNRAGTCANCSNGKSISVIGNRAYLGRTFSKLSGSTDTIPELHIIDMDTSDPSAIATSSAGSLALPTSGDSINGVVVRDHLGFITSDDFFRVVDLSDSELPTLKEFDLNDLIHSNAVGSATDCEGNYLYIGAYRTSNDKGYILVFYPQL
jgi:hypothetical protein